MFVSRFRLLKLCQINGKGSIFHLKFYFQFFEVGQRNSCSKYFYPSINSSVFVDWCKFSVKIVPLVVNVWIRLCPCWHPISTFRNKFEIFYLNTILIQFKIFENCFRCKSNKGRAFKIVYRPIKSENICPLSCKKATCFVNANIQSLNGWSLKQGMCV